MKNPITLLLIFQLSQLFNSANTAFKVPALLPFRSLSGCYEYGIGHLRPGETIHVPYNCRQGLCNADGTITYASCYPKYIGEGPECINIPPNYSKRYPDCCPYKMCF